MSVMINSNDVENQWENFKYNWDETINIFREFMWREARFRLGDDDLAEDISQEAYFKLAKCIVRKEGEGRYSIYKPHPQMTVALLREIVRNLIIDQVRRKEGKRFVYEKEYIRWVPDFIDQKLKSRIDIPQKIIKKIEKDLKNNNYTDFQKLNYKDAEENKYLKEIKSVHRRMINIEEIDIDEPNLQLISDAKTVATIENDDAIRCLWLLVNNVNHKDPELQARYRNIATLRFFGDLTHNQIAIALSISPDQVRSAYARKIKPQIKASIENGSISNDYQECLGYFHVPK